MDIMLGELLKSSFLENKVKVVCGEKNLDRMVTSVTIMETPDGHNFVRAGEFAVTSGHCWRGDNDLALFALDQLIKNKAACLGVSKRYFPSDTLLKQMIEEAQKKIFPIVLLDDDVVYWEMIEYMSLNFFSQQLHEVKRIEQVYKEVVEAIFTESLLGVAKTVNRWLGLQTIIIFQQNIFSYPQDGFLEKFPLEANKWRSMYPQDCFLGDLKAFYYEDEQEYFEWLCSEIKIDSRTVGYILTFKKDKMFSKDICMLLDFVSECCKIEMKRILLNITMLRKYRQNFLRSMIAGDLSNDEIYFEAQKLDYIIPRISQVVLFQVQERENADLFMSNMMINFETAITRTLGETVVNSSIDKNIYFCLLPVVQQDNKGILEQLYIELKNSGLEDIICGVSSEISIEQISFGYHEAMTAIKIGEILPAKNKIYYFTQLGFYRLLDLPYSYERIVKFCNHYLKPLQEVNVENRKELLETLNAFVHNNYNYRETAKAVFLHANSVRYRISLIEKLFNVNLKKQSDRLNIEVALKLLPLVLDK